MACKRMATCRARFARGEQACVRCAECRPDVGDAEDLDDGDNLDEGEIDDIDDIDDDGDDDIDDDDIDEGIDDDDDDGVGYTARPDGRFGAIADTITINGRHVPGIRVTVTENGEDEEYVIVVEDGLDGIPDDVHDAIDSEVDRYVESWESLYDVLEDMTRCTIKLK